MAVGPINTMTSATYPVQKLRHVAGVLLAFGLVLFTGCPAFAQNNSPGFVSPYAGEQPLEAYLVFSAPPRENVPDGQIHWVDAEVPGIDLRGPDGWLRSMCPETGLAWTLAAGDTYGGGGQFVAVECQGAAAGWQMLAFHLCEIQIQASISASQRQYTRVAPGTPLARECPGGHTHLSLGYWAEPEARRELACPQWYVQGRYWANPACLVQAGGLTESLPAFLVREDDWELHVLRPEVLAPLRRAALLVVAFGLVGYVLWSLLARGPAAHDEPRRRDGTPEAALAKSGILLGFIAWLVMLSAGPVWPLGASSPSRYTTAEAPYQAMAQAVGFEDWRLLRAFYLAAVPRDAAGRPAADGAPGKVFPPEAAAAIPFGETNAEEWGLIDPTQPGPYGRDRAWDAVAQRWPASLYERTVLGLKVSRTAQRQRDGLKAIAASPAMQALGRRLGKTIRPEDLYGSSAGAVGRTQILPGHFAAGGVCADVPSTDVWNDPQAVAECTTRYLTVSGCWGSWWANGDVWSALCGYNPGAWEVAEHAWYWSVLQDRMARLAAASGPLRLPTEASAAAASSADQLVPTPILGLKVTQVLLQAGQGARALPGPLSDWVAALAPQVQAPERRHVVRLVFRLFRAWSLVYYSPEELAAFGVQL